MKRVIALAVLCVSVSPMAHAEDRAENYVGVSLSKPVSGTSSTGAAITLGHRYNEHVAAEIAYEDSGALSAAPERTTAVSIAAMGFVPIVTDLEGFVRLGYASAHSKDAAGLTANHGDVTYGVGVEYRVNENYSADLGWNHLRVGDNVDIPRASENSWVLSVVRSF